MVGREREGCCLARFHDPGYVASNVDRILLRYRPIAPKPAASGESPEQNEPFIARNRSKRKYSRENKRSRKKKSVSPPPLSHPPVITLPLIPETPERRDSPARSTSGEYSPFNNGFRYIPVSFSRTFQNPELETSTSYVPIVTPHPRRPVGSCVTVEKIMDVCSAVESLGSTDEKKKMSLESDTCPVFLSDSENRVVWTNPAYRKLVSHSTAGISGSGEEEIVVSLVVKVDIPSPPPQAFTCHVRVQYASKKERSVFMAPCDVWKLDAGGFAWRLDLKTALSLGI